MGRLERETNDGSLPPDGSHLNGDVAEPVETGVLKDGIAVVRLRLHCQNTSALADAAAGDQTMESEMRADIDIGVSRFE